MHLYLPLFHHRDYFHRPVSSLSCIFLPQGLLCPGQMHLYLALLFRRDYFERPDASLSCSFAPQGLFPPTGCISILLFCSAGIISAGQMHPITGRPSLKASRPFRQLLICSAKIVYHSVVIPTAILITPSLSKDSIFVFSASA